jgi:hypothetical protein
MPVATRIETISTDEDASRLMPGGSSQPHLVVFCGDGSRVLEKVERLLEEADFPVDWRLARIDPELAEMTAQWFGVGEGSSMAVIREGAILAIEQECSIDAFARLIEVAKRRDDLIESA